MIPVGEGGTELKLAWKEIQAKMEPKAQFTSAN